MRLNDAQLDAITAGTDVTVTALVADVPGQAPHLDPNLVNPWGLAASPTGPLWVSNQGSGTSTVYQSDGTPASTVVTIPSPSGGPGHPTGLAFNGNPDFAVTSAGKSAPSSFVFATEDGTIAGWSQAVNPSQAVIAVDQSKQGAVFKGLAIAQVGGADQLFAADFGNNQVKVFNSQFQQTGAFTDPSVPAGFAPFNVQNLPNNMLAVAFAVQDPTKHVDVPGAGAGIIDIFSTSGQLIRRLTTGGSLNAPWGMLVAPSTFGPLTNALLVGNFGDGRVNAFDLNTGALIGQLTVNGQPLALDGLWALRPTQGSPGTVTFSAGPNRGQNGLIGNISVAATMAAAPAAAPAAPAAAAPAPAPAPAAMPMANASMMAATQASSMASRGYGY